MMLGWLRSQALRPFYEADAGSTGSGDGSSTPPGAGQAEIASQASAQAAGGTTESADDRAARLERELTETRKEAAKYRVTLRSQEQAQTEAQRKAAEESGQFKTLYEQAQAKLAEVEQAQAKAAQDAARAKAARDAGLSEDLADRLVGDTPEALLLDAKALAKRLVPTPPSTGATNPGAKRAGASEDEQIEAMFHGKGKQPKSGMRW